MKIILLFVAFFTIFNFGAGKLFAQTEDYTYHKAFIEDESRNYHVIEFKDSGIYIDQKRMATLKVFTGGVLADFNDNDERFFVVLTAETSGTCGYVEFAIVSIDEKLNVKVSAKSPNNQCLGELPNIVIRWNKKYQRIISIADTYEYNLDTQKWSLARLKATRKRTK